MWWKDVVEGCGGRMWWWGDGGMWWRVPSVRRRRKYLDGVNIMGEDHQLGALGLDEGGHGVNAIDDGEGALDGVEGLSLRLGLGELGETLLPLEFSLRLVLVEESEQGAGCRVGGVNKEWRACV
jgi:hypothetical protein